MMMEGQPVRLTIRPPVAGVSAVGISTRRRPVISWMPGLKALKVADVDWTCPGRRVLRG